MEPATLWFERRARKVKRVTSGKLLGPWPGFQRAATIHRFCSEYLEHNVSALVVFSVDALSGQGVPQGAFVVSAELHQP
jgi:hypothetical protein